MDGQDFGDHECMVPGWETVRKTWNNFTAAWQRVYPRRAIGRGEARSVTEASISFLRGERISNTDLLYSSYRGPLPKKWVCRNTSANAGLLERRPCINMRSSFGLQTGSSTKALRPLLMIGA